MASAQVIVTITGVIECDDLADAQSVLDSWDEGDVLSVVSGTMQVVALEIVEGS